MQGDSDEPSISLLELDFSAEHRAISKVVIEGSSQSGYTITVEADDKFELVTKIQLNSKRVVIMLVPKEAIAAVDHRPKTDGPWVVEFESSQWLRANSLPRTLLDNFEIYRAGNGAKRFRVGFFPSKTAAKDTLRKIRGRYVGAKVLRAGRSEPKWAALLRVGPTPSGLDRQAPSREVVTRIRAVTPKNIGETRARVVDTLAPKTDEIDRSLLDQAMASAVAKNWSQAIALYTKATNVPALRAEALERLGVARERKGQLAQAKSVYTEYLAEFDGHTNANRVRQRLNSLVGDTKSARLREPSRKSQVSWNKTGFVSQFYRRHSIEIDGSETVVPIDAVFTDATAMVRTQGATATHEGRVSLGHILDFSTREVDKTFRIQRAYWDTFYKPARIGVRVGRQSRHKTGVLGRFDGLSVRYKPSKRVTWHAVAGQQLASTYDDPAEEDRPFYGVSADISLFSGQVEVSPFLIEQHRDGILDRRAVGSYFHLRKLPVSLAGRVDYDIHHEVLNNLYLTTRYDLNENWRVNGTYDYRQSPYLTTGNALIGQRFDDLSELEQSLINMKLQDVAEDRTATSTSYRFGVDGNIAADWMLSLDAAMTDYSATGESLGVSALPERNDVSFGAQIRGNGLLTTSGYSAIQVRYMDSDTATTSSVYLTNRFKLRPQWHLLPRMVATHRVFDATDFAQLQIKPSIRVDYRGFGNFQLEAEVGYDWSTRETVFDDIETIGLFLQVGYRARF